MNLACLVPFFLAFSDLTNTNKVVRPADKFFMSFCFVCFSILSHDSDMPSGFHR